MRTRVLFGLLLPAMLVLGLVLPATAAVAAPASEQTQLVLATEAGGEAPGPDPAGPNDEENPGAPDNYKRPPIWWGSWLFLFAGAGALLAVGGGYYLQVVRANAKAEAAKQAEKKAKATS